MTQDKIKICDLIIASLGDKLVVQIDGMTESDTLKWSNVMKVLEYKKIIRLHLQNKSYDEIQVDLLFDNSAVGKLLCKGNNGTAACYPKWRQYLWLQNRWSLLGAGRFWHYTHSPKTGSKDASR